MAKVTVDVQLKDGIDQTIFLNDVTSNTEVDLKNGLDSLPNLVILNVEESYINTLKNHSSVLDATQTPEPKELMFPNPPSILNRNDQTITLSQSPSGYESKNGIDQLSLQHWIHSDIKEQSDLKIGGLRTHPRQYDDQSSLENVNYSSRYNGKHVDIVAFEAGGALANERNMTSHPDFADPDNTSQSRCVKVDWPDLTSVSNNPISKASQTENTGNASPFEYYGLGSIFNIHSIPVMSCAGGRTGGFASRSNLMAIFISGGDTAIECINSIKKWHQNKSNNPTTGLKNPTIVCQEFGYPQYNVKHSVKIDDIASITDPTHGTTNRPSGGWGSDLTPFVKRLSVPFQILDPNTGTWAWHILLPEQSEKYTTFRTAIKECWDAGVFWITTPSNWGSVTVSDSDPRHDGTYIDLDSGTNDLYNHNLFNDDNEITKSSTSTTRWYTLRQWGAIGMDEGTPTSAKVLKTCAGIPSEGVPVLSSYTGRGPCVELVGMGNFMWCAGGSTSTTWGDGYTWRTFGGNSGSVPSIAGKVACYMEKHYVLNGVWPTSDQAKATILSEARNEIRDNTPSTTWSNVPTASDNDFYPLASIHVSGQGHVKMKNTQYTGGYFSDLCGTSQKRVFYNNKEFNREQTYKERPTSGVLFPRPRKFDIPKTDTPDLTSTS